MMANVSNTAVLKLLRPDPWVSDWTGAGEAEASIKLNIVKPFETATMARCFRALDLMKRGICSV